VLITVPGIVDSTHPDAANYTLTWSPSRLLLVEAIEAINRTNPCSVAIIIRDRGTTDNLQGCCLLCATVFQLATWNNFELPLDTHDEIAVIFQRCIIGDVVALKIHVRTVPE